MSAHPTAAELRARLDKWYEHSASIALDAIAALEAAERERDEARAAMKDANSAMRDAYARLTALRAATEGLARPLGTGPMQTWDDDDGVSVEYESGGDVCAASCRPEAEAIAALPDWIAAVDAALEVGDEYDPRICPECGGPRDHEGPDYWACPDIECMSRRTKSLEVGDE